MPRMAEGGAASGSSPAGAQGVAPSGNPMAAASQGGAQRAAMLPAGAAVPPSRYPSYPYVLQAVSPPYGLAGPAQQLMQAEGMGGRVRGLPHAMSVGSMASLQVLQQRGGVMAVPGSPGLQPRMWGPAGRGVGEGTWHGGGVMVGSAGEGRVRGGQAVLGMIRSDSMSSQVGGATKEG